MKQTWLGPATMGGSMMAGAAAMLVGGYKIVDCIRYQSGPGVCNEVVETNAMAVVGGIAAVVGPLGGLFTYNPDLEPPGAGKRRKRGDGGSDFEPPLEELPPRSLVVIDQDPRVTFEVAKPAAPAYAVDVEESLRESFRQAISEGIIPPAAPESQPEPEPLEDPWLDEERVSARIQELSDEGWTQAAIAEFMGVTLYRVRKALGRA